jgi:hypothetical protein
MAQGVICRVSKVVPLCRNWEAVYMDGKHLPAPARRDSMVKGQNVLFFETNARGVTGTYPFKGLDMRGAVVDPSLYDLDEAPINSRHEIDSPLLT